MGIRSAKRRQRNGLCTKAQHLARRKSIPNTKTWMEKTIRALENQHGLDKDNERKLSKERETYRLGGKDLV